MEIITAYKSKNGKIFTSKEDALNDDRNDFYKKQSELLQKITKKLNDANQNTGWFMYVSVPANRNKMLEILNATESEIDSIKVD